MLTAYRQHAAERAALGVPPLPLSAQQTAELVELLKNPPVGEEAFLLDLIANRVPAGVDDAAKVKASYLAAVAFGTEQCSLISRDKDEINAFRAQHGDVVMKPLYGHGGAAVFRITPNDMNFGSLYDMFAVTFREPWVIQRFLPEVKHGDKRIILVDGEFAGAVNRVPAADDLRSNMVRGGAAAATDLSPREREICERLGPALRERGLLFVGIDVIDGHLTEINVTSPTGIRAIARLGGPDVAAKIWDTIAAKRG